MIDANFAMSTPLTVLAITGASIFGLYLVTQLIGLVFAAIGQVFGLVGGLIGRVGLFVGKEIQDVLHLVGGILTGVVIAPLSVANAVLGRFDRAGHYGRAFASEAMGTGASLYRVALGNPIWFLGLSPMTEGLERRVPDLVSRAPARSRRKGKGGKPGFDGYTVTGELEPGGSGARLFLARPQADTLTRYRDAGHPDPGQVVLKSFDLASGSTVPQIVRESRSLEAAKSLGLVLDHEVRDGSFWYAMPFVPGEDLDVVTRRLHAGSGEDGLSDRGISYAMGYTADLLTTLDRFHRAGLWHKDIKPGNLIISEKRAHLVDFGLVTPLASAMTLTTHGTEFFRDPELVRMAMKGVRVQDVDGVKFDLYSAGALLYSLVENSFPAHGNLSRMTKRCPDALAFIVRRAMADMSQRYGSADQMGADLEVLLAARDPWAVKPADLPSMDGAPRARQASHQPVPPYQLEDDPPPVRPVGPTPATRPARTSRGALGWLSTAALFMLMLGGMSVLARTAWTRARDHQIVLQHTVLRDAQLAERAARRVGTAAALEAAEVEGRVLLLPCSGLGDIDGVRTEIAGRGHTLVGNGSDPESIELMARARSAMGLSQDLDDPAALGRLQSFLDSSEGVDALVWLAPLSSGSDFDFRVLMRSGR